MVSPEVTSRLHGAVQLVRHSVQLDEVRPHKERQTSTVSQSVTGDPSHRIGRQD